jgi:hypothetical protein
MKKLLFLLLLIPIAAFSQDAVDIMSGGGGGASTDTTYFLHGTDTTALSDRIDLKLDISDTAAFAAGLRGDISDSLANLTIGANIAYYADTILVVINDSLHIVYKPRNLAVTATDNGLTTGLLTKGDKNITVTSGSADYIVCLPSTAAADIGTVITGQVGANGFELRPVAAQAATVYINGVTDNVEAAIPANTSFEIRCIDATHWILKAWSNLGAVLTAIVPDAI